MSRLFITLAAALALAGSLPAGAEVATFGYSNGQQGRKNVFSNNSSVSGLALRLNPGKTALLKGRSITGVRVSLGSRNTVNKQAQLFLSNGLGAEALRSATATISEANEWLDFMFDEPFTITEATEDLYIGYTLEVTNSNYKPLSADFSDDIEGVAYIYDGTEWKDLYGSGRGMPNVYAILDAPVEFTDIIVKPFSGTDSYMRPGEGDKVQATVYNLGSATINSMEGVVVCHGKETPLKLEGLDIPHAADYSFPLPAGYDKEIGTSQIATRIDRINGEDDADPSDNSADDRVCFYPADNERGVMIDFFTGQGCPQCPGGHNTLHNTLESLTLDDELFYVAHHAGYYPDLMTSAMAMDLTSLYNGGTYAPAFAVNRMPDESGMVVAQISASDIKNRIERALTSEPFVSLDINTDIDPDTRMLSLDAKIYCFKEIDAEQVAFNAFIVQDNIVGYQSNGGNDYTHNNVDRIPLFESTWGKECPLKTGEVTEISTSIQIPERIRSDYWTDDNITSLGAGAHPPVTSADVCTFDAPLEDLTLVVYVARHGNRMADSHAIVNAMRLNLGEDRRQKGFPDPSGVEVIADNTPTCRIYVENGMIRAEGNYSILQAFTPAGKAVNIGSPLPPGIYIVRAAADSGEATVKKIIIR